MLDHVGGPLGIGAYAGKRDEVFADWRASSASWPTAPNVIVKLGGLGMRINGFGFHAAAERRPPRRSWPTPGGPTSRPASRRSAPTRCMFESNFPVDKGSGPYATYWNAFKRLAAGASAEEKAALFRETAKRFYRLD